MVSKHYGVRVSPFTADETKRFTKEFDALPPDRAAAMLGSLSQALGRDGMISFAGRIPLQRPALAMAIAFVHDNKGVSGEIVAGLPLLRDNPPDPDDPRRSAIIDKVAGPMFTSATAPGRRFIRAATDALHAARRADSFGPDPSKTDPSKSGPGRRVLYEPLSWGRVFRASAPMANFDLN